jgi:hypothetical protein
MIYKRCKVLVIVIKRTRRIKRIASETFGSSVFHYGYLKKVGQCTVQTKVPVEVKGLPFFVLL